MGQCVNDTNLKIYDTYCFSFSTESVKLIVKKGGERASVPDNLMVTSKMKFILDYSSTSK